MSKSLGLSALLLMMAGAVAAAPVVTTAVSGPNDPSTTTDEVTFAADVSSSDLLHGLTGTGGTWNPEGSGHAGLNDGLAGGDADADGILPALNGTSWAKHGSGLTYTDFVLAPASSGYDITGIQSIAAWSGAGFSNQKYEVRFRHVGEASFPESPSFTVDYQPFSDSLTEGGSTKVNVTDSIGILASGVDAIRITVLETISNPVGGAIFREIDVFGTPTIDTIAPAILNLSPADNALNVPGATNLVVTFNEGIAIDTGNLTVKNLTDKTQTTIVVTDASQVSVAGSVLTINPTADLSVGKNYAVRIDAGAIKDAADNPFAGIANDTIWNFTTGNAPLRIMCLGDSITVGYTDNPGWTNHPFKFGYRSGLHGLLTNAGYSFRFVGGSTEPWTGISGDPTHGGTYKPAFDLRDIGQDGHRGYGGTTASGLQGGIAAWLASDNPDLILLKVGTNSQDTAALNTLVNTIFTTKPDVRLIVARIMPKYTYEAGIVSYNNYIRDTLVPNYQALGRNISMVDQYAPFLTNPADLTSIDQALFSDSFNHPSNPGYDKMAQVWFAGIEALGIAPNNFTRWIGGYPAVGSQTGLEDDPDHDGIPNGVENFFGTSPVAASAGVNSVQQVGNTFTLTHPRNATPAEDIAVAYLWSKDLTTFKDSGTTDFDGTTVAITPQPDTPQAGTTTVTTTVTGTAAPKLFVKVKVTRN